MVISCVATQLFNIFVSRFSVAMTAMFLIWLGMILNQRLKWDYDNCWILFFSMIVFAQSVLLQKGRITMAKNEYQDVVYLCVGTISYIYILGFIAKRIERTLIGRFFSLLGKESFYIMALHIVGLYTCNSLLVCLNIVSSTSKRGLYTFLIGDDVALLMLYVAFGILVPLIIIWMVRRIKAIFIRH